MRINNKDETLKKNYIQKYQFLIKEYELVKSGKHKKYKRVGEFYAAHGTCRQIFLKYYGRYKNNKDEKSQHKNKAKALKILRSRIYDLERQKKEQERASSRKGQVGSGDRSERIRTYNFPQSRISDHRINLTSHNIDEVLKEGKLDEFIDALIASDEATKLAQDLN